MSRIIDIARLAPAAARASLARFAVVALEVPDGREVIQGGPRQLVAEPGVWCGWYEYCVSLHSSPVLMRHRTGPGTSDWNSGHAERGARRPLRFVADDEIHVWFCLPHAADASAHAFALLDIAEVERASGFRQERDRTRFISHHAFTRRVLARYLDTSPAQLTMHTSPRGRPAVDPAYGIDFNTSRSGGLSVVAVSRGRVGIDTEAVRPIDDAAGLADGLFTEEEQRSLQAAPRASRDDAFLELWTRKESVVKAFGTGLSAPLDTFEVGAAGDAQDGYRGRFGAESFVVRQIEAPFGWKVAACVLGTRLTVRRMDPALQGPL